MTVEEEQQRTTKPRRRRARRVAIVLMSVLLLVAVALTAGVWGLQERYDRNIERFADPFVSIPEASRPAVSTTGAQTFLLVGSDSRISTDPAAWEVGGQRTDAVLLLHLPADRSAAFVMSIPRDTWVNVPERGEAKINAAFSLGGPSLLVSTVEQLTGTRLDHLAIVDFEGFVEMTDALGGVTITVPRETGDSAGTFAPGTTRMDGETALRYVRQRSGLAGGDFDRVLRQQNWMRSVAGEALSRDVLADPRRLDAFLGATTSAVALDEGFGIGEIRDLAVGLRGLRADDLVFFTVPLEGTGRSADGQSIVLLDRPRADTLWTALRQDGVGAWVEQNPDVLTADEVS